MKNFIIFFFLILIQYFQRTNCQVQFEYLSVEDFINKINDVQLKTEDYNNIIKYIREVLSKYYVYWELANSTLLNIEPIDLDKKLESINSQNTNFLDFYNSLYNAIKTVKDDHLNVIFQNILENYFYFLPVNFNVKTDKDNKTHLYYNMAKENPIKKAYNTTYFESLKQFEYLNIKSINKNDPFDFILNFQNSLKDEHAQFSINLYTISKGNIFNFTKNKFDIIEIEFEGNQTIKLEYKVALVKSQTKQFQLYYKEKIDKYLKSYNIPSIFEIIKEYNNEKKKDERLLQTSIWDANLENKIKYKIDENNKVNVIFQSSFMFSSNDAFKFFGEMMEKFSKNDFPIIVIESLNGGGIIAYSSIFQKALNFNSGMSKAIMALRYSIKNLDNLKEFLAVNITSCDSEKIIKDNNSIYSDNFDNVIFKRSDFFFPYNTYEPLYLLQNYNHSDREPTKIIIFTDGYSFSTTSFFIKDLQESGNAIIVGYNGIPNDEKKTIKFNGSQSPSSVVTLHQAFIKDETVNLLKTKYNITISCTYGASYDYSYQNKSKLQFPREYTINPIDERSSIYGSFDDSRYLEFVKEGKRIIEKYKTYCNTDNLNLLLKNDSCKFGNETYMHGGMECSKNGTWGNECKPYYCDIGYYFDTYDKKCKEDKCKIVYEKYLKNLRIVIILIIIALIIGLLCCVFICYRCFCKKKQVTSRDIGSLIPES